ncbi:hypothetical protein K432DRAFT_382837 [Lepidopterella palustris CBS 459.81]|uniref:Uncharacterized protein n=1 Tax=Lepidopterella palustris CBS 459.81 TaxID=1314670 RepID=A0A8E2E9E8_9PEZI|nr:hypothetical protein K432DRAFT_382837 [Lepidopterella palustris CBS 459.81]
MLPTTTTTSPSHPPEPEIKLPNNLLEWPFIPVAQPFRYIPLKPKSTPISFNPIQPPHPQRQSPLLALPPELRNLIYNWLFSSTSATLRPRPSHNLRILRTCRLVFTEARALAYSLTMFVVGRVSFEFKAEGYLQASSLNWELAGYVTHIALQPDMEKVFGYRISRLPLERWLKATLLRFRNLRILTFLWTSAFYADVGVVLKRLASLGRDGLWELKQRREGRMGPAAAGRGAWLMLLQMDEGGEVGAEGVRIVAVPRVWHCDVQVRFQEVKGEGEEGEEGQVKLEVKRVRKALEESCWEGDEEDGSWEFGTGDM